ncbi:hypothetical protein CNMCM5793_000184 [Aspergillus hiratsukae]|uniref:Secreted protein n=1 Tax=Aspergillus hiratsukae TaxID=1194566 RepID=A0A8H6P9L8_9EURO|nr:hypothetical protein CNMCM5793_000184 [Aspergillus hiratsukae]KAF7164728.1 hypothetical protein CNMCM6106_001140 [Aspergillus hiratsukae]
MQIKALLCVSLASGAVAQLCDANELYCGWYLSNNIGKYTSNPEERKYSATYLEHCAFNCTGPIAACATAPSPDPEPTTTSTTMTTTKHTGRPTTTKPSGSQSTKPY